VTRTLLYLMDSIIDIFRVIISGFVSRVTLMMRHNL